MLQRIRLLCVLTLGAFALAAQTIPVATVRTTAMVGIAAGQTARLNVLNPGVLPPALGTVCTAEVAFLDGAGTVRKTAPVTVDPGRSVFVDLHSDTDLALTPADRLEIRATITEPGALPPLPTSNSGSPATAPACKLVATLEVFDNVTGRTQAIVGRTVSLN